MQHLPVVFLSFANDAARPLPELTAENEQVYFELLPLANEGRFMLHLDAYATTEKIGRALTLFHKQVQIFHYSGHAGGDSLHLVGGEARATGIAGQLALQKDLKLVFLNGCSTGPQVQALLDMGVPAIIATSSEINDTLAQRFSTAFYQALAQRHTIGEAFDKAKAEIDTATGGVSLTRGIGSVMAAEASDDFEWGLYLADATAADWKLPAEAAATPILLRGSHDVFHFGQSPVNEELTRTLYESMSEYVPDMRSGGRRRGRPDVRRLRQDIMDYLPAPIAEQVRKLFAAESGSQDVSLDDINADRLRQLATTYDTLMQFFVFILINELWDEQYEEPTVSLPEQSLGVLRDFIVRLPEHPPVDYVELMKALYELLEAHDRAFYLDELQALRAALDPESEFEQAHTFMERLKITLHGTVSSDEVESLCVQAEQQLSIAFKHLAFCARYQYVSIKQIGFVKERNQDPRYVHRSVYLDRITAGVMDEEYEYTNFADSRAVVVLKDDVDGDERSLDSYLNLSPFIIDENAYTGDKKCKLYFFDGFRPRKRQLKYRFSYIPDDELLISQQRLPEVHAQVEDFVLTIFGKTLTQLTAEAADHA